MKILFPLFFLFSLSSFAHIIQTNCNSPFEDITYSKSKSSEELYIDGKKIPNLEGKKIVRKIESLFISNSSVTNSCEVIENSTRLFYNEKFSFSGVFTIYDGKNERVLKMVCEKISFSKSIGSADLCANDFEF